MKKIIFLTALCSLFLLSACSAPRLNIFDTTPNPLQEFTLEGKGKDKILIIPVNGMISDSPQAGFVQHITQPCGTGCRSAQQGPKRFFRSKPFY